MSPRAAWRLDALGLPRVHDYVGGKSDWLAADLPYEGEARLVGRVVRRGVPVADVGEPVDEARRRRERAGFGPLVAVNEVGVVMGVLRQEELAAATGDMRVGEAIQFGVPTVRPSEEVEGLVHRMAHGGIGRIVVTRADGTLVGLFVVADVQGEDAAPVP